MSILLSHRVLFPGMLAGALVFTGAACSRSDRTESGRNTAAVTTDTSSNAAQPSGGTSTAALSDTSTASNPSQPGDSAQPGTADQPSASGAQTAPGGKKVAGSRSMKHHTNRVHHADSARVSVGGTDSTDSAATVASADVAPTTNADTLAGPDVTADTATAGYAAMARDTSTEPEQADTAATSNGDVAGMAAGDTSSQAVSASAGVAAADTANNAGRIRPPEDSTEILGQVTTDSTPGAGSPDSSQVVRIRPPEDSTEILGRVSTDETADEHVVRSGNRTDEVGAAAVGSNVTGADAVALMTREGLRCRIADPEENKAVLWDMASTPITLNPCGLGSMVLSKIWTEGAPGQR